MILIPSPLTLEGPTSRQIGRKLAKVIALMRAQKPLQESKKPRFRNGMEALAQWEADAADKF